MKLHTLIVAAIVLAVGLGGVWAATDKPATHESHRKEAASRPADHFGRMPLPIDQTIEKQNSPQDKLRIDVTHSELREGKHVAFIRIVWGDLDNLIKEGGRQYFSDWDGSVTFQNATGLVVHKIAFDDGKATTRPANQKTNTASRPGHEKGLSDHHPKREATSQPDQQNGRDQLIDASGPVIEWKAGVVGAIDGLLIKVTSEKPTVEATIKAGKFTVPVKITPNDPAAK